MKKTIILVIIALTILVLCKNTNDKIVIPKESIRIRIIANSNDEVDIENKLKIKNDVEKRVYSLIKDATTIKEAREIISNNLDNLNIELDNSVAFGYNYFPRKVYKNVIYESGMYESLVITIGKGEGSNFWCVLFPPLCLLDDNETTDDVEYSFFVKEIIDKFKNGLY